MTGTERRLLFKTTCKARHETQTAVCERLGVSAAHVTFVLLGDRRGSDGLRDRLAQYAGVSPGEFWGSGDGLNGGSSVEQKTEV